MSGAAQPCTMYHSHCRARVCADHAIHDHAEINKICHNPFYLHGNLDELIQQLNVIICCVELQRFTKCPPNITKPPLVDFLVSRSPSQSLSLHAVKPVGGSCHRSSCTKRGLPTRYLATRLNASQSCSQGLAMNLLTFFASYCKSIRSNAR